VTSGKRPVALLCVFLAAAPAAPGSLALPALASREKNTTDPAIKNYNEGIQRMKKGQIDGAIDSFLQSIDFARNNYNPWAWFFLGECYKLKNDRENDTKAVEAFRKHLDQVVGRSPEAHIELGEVYMRMDRDEDARTQFNDALIEYMGPGPRAHNALGKLAVKQGDLSVAIGHFRDALGDPPWTYTEAWMNMADCYMKLRNFGEAVGQYLEMMKAERLKLTDADRQRIYLNLGLALLGKGDHEGAMRSWRECLSLNPSNAEAHLDLGMLFDQESHISSAITEYKAFVRLAPADPGTQKVKDRIALLEQKLAPAEPVAQEKPTPYMRRELEEHEAEKRKAFQQLGSPQPQGESPF